MRLIIFTSFHCRLLALDMLDVFHNVHKVIESGNNWYAEADRGSWGNKHDLIPLFFFMCVYIL